MFQTPVGRVRAVGMVEAVSFLLLVFIAMPIKYCPPKESETALLGEKIVFWVGLIHGVLFITYAIITFVAWGQGAIRFKHVAMAAVASILPFGPFVIDRKLKAVEKPTAQPEVPA